MPVESEIVRATKLLVGTYAGKRGTFAYEAFEYINERFFDNELPWPLIVWGITAHGGCLGLTASRTDHPPTIVLHPSLLGGTGSSSPWGIDPDLLGAAYAFDVLLHECVHVAVNYLHGGAEGDSSHNNQQWVDEVNRLLPLLRLRGVRAGISKVKRVPDKSKPRIRGRRPPTKTARVHLGEGMPFACVAAFPHAVRVHLGKTAFYRRGLPFENALERVDQPEVVVAFES